METKCIGWCAARWWRLCLDGSKTTHRLVYVTDILQTQDPTVRSTRLVVLWGKERGARHQGDTYNGSNLAREVALSNRAQTISGAAAATAVEEKEMEDGMVCTSDNRNEYCALRCDLVIGPQTKTGSYSPITPTRKPLLTFPVLP